MNDLQEQLKDLRDIHLPDPVSVWPLAPGWWALLIGIPLLYFILRIIFRRLMMPKYKKLALSQLKNIAANFAVAKNKTETAGEISLLIRQALVAKIGHAEVAGLVGEEWLAYLDKLSKTHAFTQGAGRYIISAPFAKQADVDIDELLSATKKLLGKL